MPKSCGRRRWQKTTRGSSAKRKPAPDQTPAPSASANDVDLRGEQRGVRGQIDPGEQANPEPEGAVDVACVLERVPNVVAAECLKKRVEDAGADRPAAQVPPA